MNPNNYTLAFQSNDYSYDDDLMAGRCHVVLPAEAGYGRLSRLLEFNFRYRAQQQGQLKAQVNRFRRVKTILPEGNVSVIPWVGNRPPETEELFIGYLREVFLINEREIKSSVVVLDFRECGFNTRYFERHFREHFKAADLGACVTEVVIPRDYAHDQAVKLQANAPT